MRFEPAFKTASMLVALSGLLSLLMSGEATLWLVLPALALPLAGMAFPSLLDRPAPATGTLALIGAAALAFSVVDFFFIGGSLLVAGADLLVLLLCIKLVSLKAGRDYLQMYTASFFLLLASTGLYTEAHFLLAFVMFFVSAVWAMMLLTVRADALEITGRVPDWRVKKTFFAGTAALTLASFAVTLAIFFIMPRVGIGFFSKRAGALIRTSGFSDSVDLGSMGEVKLDPTVVMRVEFPGAALRPEGRLYWRGRAFDRYDGRSWEDTTLTARRELFRGREGAFAIRPGEDAAGPALVQNIMLEPLDTSTIFALYPAYELSSSFRRIWLDGSGGLHLPYPPGSRVFYTVRSMPPGATREGFDKVEGGLTGRRADRYLQLPSESGELAGLARSVTREAKGPDEKAEMIMSHLSSDFGYTLSPTPGGGKTPIDDFLFHTKRGYCEHFATAMVLMLRAAGVPARMVAGFSGGEWNYYGGYFLVRESDAHTWVEAYIPGRGWVVYDPTPAAAPVEAPLLLPRRISDMLDYLRFRWDRYIVYFSLGDQVKVAGAAAGYYLKVKRFLSEAVIGLKASLPTPGAWQKKGSYGPGALAAGIAVLGIVAGLALFFALKRGGRRTLKRTGFYHEMVRILAQKGLRRKPGDTPMEFARAIAAEGNENHGQIWHITMLYYRVRFGGIHLSETERARVRLMLRTLRGR